MSIAVDKFRHINFISDKNIRSVRLRPSFAQKRIEIFVEKVADERERFETRSSHALFPGAHRPLIHAQPLRKLRLRHSGGDRARDYQRGEHYRDYFENFLTLCLYYPLLTQNDELLI